MSARVIIAQILHEMIPYRESNILTSLHHKNVNNMQLDTAGEAKPAEQSQAEAESVAPVGRAFSGGLVVPSSGTYTHTHIYTCKYAHTIIHTHMNK